MHKRYSPHAEFQECEFMPWLRSEPQTDPARIYLALQTVITNSKLGTLLCVPCEGGAELCPH
ncbi:MAG: hypothetical protein ACP5MD_07790 [Verrucomicrobiia bacterium]